MISTVNAGVDKPIFLYGPSGSGKSTAGNILAKTLDRSFYDLDELIVAHAGSSIEDIFTNFGEAKFRALEREQLQSLPLGGRMVVALGGGALLDSGNLAYVERRGIVICLYADMEVLFARVNADQTARPLIGSDGAQDKMSLLLVQREAHYKSFERRIETGGLSPEETAWQIQLQTGCFRVTGMGQPYDVIVAPGSIDTVGSALLERGLSGPIPIISDNNVAPLYVQRVADSLDKSGYKTAVITNPAGEESKNIATVERVWSQLVRFGIERGSTALALGGGVVGDLAGFTASTYMRGINWVVMPTTLLSMCDASLGGKTGVDLPEGKNLVGAFHSPGLVLADPRTLHTLPKSEIRNGMAEVLKSGIIADPKLVEICSAIDLDKTEDFREIISRSMAVKVRVITEDPYEKGLRASLNLGHTYGHAIEAASGFSLSHGEAIAIGMVLEAALAEQIQLANQGIRLQTEVALTNLGLPIRPPSGMSWDEIKLHMGRDKKNAAGKIRFALPATIGDVRTGITVEEEQICDLYLSFTDQT
jgi:3-dehydroquinate synthase